MYAHSLAKLYLTLQDLYTAPRNSTNQGHEPTLLEVDLSAYQALKPDFNDKESDQIALDRWLAVFFGGWARKHEASGYQHFVLLTPFILRGLNNLQHVRFLGLVFDLC